MPPDPPKPPTTPICTGCGPTPHIPVPPVCSADSFISREGHLDGDRIIVTLNVKSEFDGIVYFLIPYGVPEFRVGNGDLPLPQVGVLKTQTLHAGVNIVIAPAPSPSEWAGGQWEGGCYTDTNRPPLVLTWDNLYSFDWLDSGWWNFEPR